jgi:hypothetical protein
MAKNRPGKGGGGNSHQRIVAKRTSAGTIVMSRSSVEAYIFAIIAILLAVVPMTWWLRGLGLLALIPIACDLIWHSPITHQAGATKKAFFCVLTVIVIGTVAALILPGEYTKEANAGIDSTKLLRIDKLEFGADDPKGVYMNVYFTDIDDRAINTTVRYVTEIYDPPLSPSPTELHTEEENAWSSLHSVQFSQNLSIPPGRTMFMSAFYFNTPPQQRQKLTLGRAAFLAAGTFNYSDKFGDHQKEFCVWYMNQQNVYCREHNN